ncbi:hypothetical protein NEMBOFW57_005504 [Staphylotrichum longicolle]|uniref:C2H2-type domain-containing protein n=1 Tax=Staphylotrichum longicolle TaxID=669026 RepID=A0AAD4HZS4_9PEZI|nr:hypothetical protein NEMBOFW57_005504 [Staphylotrichum longicolle]
MHGSTRTTPQQVRCSMLYQMMTKTRTLLNWPTPPTKPPTAAVEQLPSQQRAAPAAKASPVKRQKAPPEMLCCLSCEFFPAPGPGQRRKMEKHKQTDGHRRKTGQDSGAELKRFSCWLCAKIYNRQDNLFQHIRNSHGVQRNQKKVMWRDMAPMASSIARKALSLFSHLFAGAVQTVRTITCRKSNNKSKIHRSPCPMLNALANHGYLPRDGKDISLARLVTALQDSINLAPDATLIAGVIALKASTTGNALTFHLIIEHDGSLSRHDIHPPPADNHSFAPEVWATVVSQFGESETISIETAAKARKVRVEAARDADPAGFSMSAGDQKASVIETCLYLRVFGEGVEGKAKKEWVRVLFEQERLPFEQGFTRSEKLLTISDILTLEEKVNAATVEGGK